ncbi:hydrogenase small subunit [Sporomusa sp.]|uniref:hydrogenase small subunit n=1 Tax=Sporomusa sp. TaxID=2078658 RepID=UPI002C7030EE|nr:hydrogenase small subunit [Sporomusa sp.]HWR08026.1 hydrogenase small subunit [Sporomusa sp.]
MTAKQTLEELFQINSLSRRQFIKVCCALTGILGLPPTALPQVMAKAQRQTVIPVIWLQGQGCSGCSMAFLSSNAPPAAEAILNMVRVEYHELLSSAAGQEAEQHRSQLMQDFSGKYLVVAEGAVPVAEAGCCSVGGVPYIETLKKVAKQAAAVLAVGTCAAWGGIPAVRPNPTLAVPVDQVITDKPVIKIPGCPPIPEVLTGVVMQYTLFGRLPATDWQGRPAQFYSQTIHSTCERKPHFEAQRFAEQYGDRGTTAGWCLYKLGCRGPSTYNSCANKRWYQGLSFPIQAGAPCIGCSNSDFGVDDPSAGFS